MWIKSIVDSATITTAIGVALVLFSENGIMVVQETALTPIGLLAVLALGFFEIVGLRW